MKRIIMVKSSGTDIGIEERNKQKSFFDLQIALRIERLLGGKLPGSQFETAELDCGFSERRKIRKKAKKTNTWLSLLKMGEGKYLLLTQSVKIIDNETKPLTNQELLPCLAEAEIIAERKAHSLGSKLKREFDCLKNNAKEIIVFLKNKIKNFRTSEDK